VRALAEQDSRLQRLRIVTTGLVEIVADADEREQLPFAVDRRWHIAQLARDLSEANCVVRLGATKREPHSVDFLLHARRQRFTADVHG
jgi:hypothetical protein